MVERLLKAGADPNTAMPEGDTALMTAARTGNVAAVTRAADARRRRQRAEKLEGADGADVGGGRRTTRQRSRRCIEAGADVQARTKYQHAAALSNAAASARRAERNSDVTRQAGFMALHFAVRAGAIDAVKVLLKSGATRARHDLGRHRRAGDGDCEHALRARGLAAGAGRRSECRGQGWTPLHQIAYTRRPNTGVNNPGLVPRGKLDSLTLARKLIARGAESEPAGDEESRRHQRRDGSG